MRRLGLRGKTVLILSAALGVATSFVVVVARIQYLRDLKALEFREAAESAQRAAAIVGDDVEALDIAVRDWSTWDDTWDYVESRDPGYAKSNLSGTSTIEVLGLSAIVILDSRGDLVFENAVDVGLLPEFGAASRGSPPPGEEGRRGVALVGEQLHLSAARPIVRSDGSGPVRGTLVMTRMLDEARIARYSRLSGFPVSIRALGPGGSPAAPGTGSGAGAAAARYSGGMIEATSPLEDEGGRPVAEVVVSVRRQSEGSEIKTLALTALTIAFILVGIGVAAVLLFEAIVLGRMRSLGIQLDDIASGRVPNGRIAESGADELAELAASINRSLDSLYYYIRQKDTAIREINHRVKNNLQIIVSLLGLQADRESSWDIAFALRECQRRVLAMAYVHEDIYYPGDLEKVRLDNLLGQIAAACRQTYRAPDCQRSVIECAGVTLPLDQAVPFGLIASEAISNSFRHAFPGGRAGTVRVSVRELSGDAILLEVEDDGIGIAPGGGARSGASPEGGFLGELGLDMVEALAGQIGGEARIGPAAGGGTIVSLTFPAGGRD